MNPLVNLLSYKLDLLLELENKTLLCQNRVRTTEILWSPFIILNQMCHMNYAGMCDRITYHIASSYFRLNNYEIQMWKISKIEWRNSITGITGYDAPTIQNVLIVIHNKLITYTQYVKIIVEDNLVPDFNKLIMLKLTNLFIHYDITN